MKKPVLMLLSLLAMALVLPATAAARDRDRDRLPDRWEKRHGLSLAKKSRNVDLDHDRVDNANEYREHTDPRDRDSDDDGQGDGREDSDRDKLNNRAEDATGNDPRDKDTDDDGIPDGREQAGVVASFDGEHLVIDLAGGGSVSGLVDEYTELYCEAEKEAEADWAKPGRASAATEDEDWVDEGDGDEELDSEDGEWEDDFEDGEEEDGDWEGEESGDEEEGEDANEDEDACPLKRLKAGARVHEAELEIDAEGAYFVAIELLLN